jgi:hypothetical protein
MGNNCCSSDPKLGGAFGDDSLTGWGAVEMIPYSDETT